MSAATGRFILILGASIALAFLGGHWLGEWGAYLLGSIPLIFPLAYSYYNLQRLRDNPATTDEQSHPALGLWGEVFTQRHRVLKEMRNRIQAIEQQHDRFIQGFQASPNGVIMLDAQNQVEWCNSSAERFFGLNFAKDAKQSITHLVRHPEFVSYLSAAEFDNPVVIERMGVASSLTVVVQVFPFADDQSLLLAQDITDLQRTEAMRRDFVANVSHEIRTPLTVLIGFLETMQSIELAPDQQNRYLDLMMTQSRRMKNLVEDLLTLAKLEANSKVAACTPFNVVAEMGALRSDAEALSKGKHQIDFAVDATHMLMAEQRELQSAFGNLISNAIRYTPEGGSISVRWSVGIDGYGEFSVTDTGPGIDSAHLARLTERFYRVDGSRSRDTGGTGLGLAIVKHIATRHHAQLHIASTLGKGSTFTLRFSPERLDVVPTQVRVSSV
jgi:two-component system, OmpR family, phosphate regulon sensor histidine kinase PhoR